MKKITEVFACLAFVLSVFCMGCTKESASKNKTITILLDRNVPTTGIEAVARLAEKEIGIKVVIDLRPGDPEGTNIVKTRLASGEMADICFCNTGSLFKALNPEKYFIDISKYEWSKEIAPSFKESVSVDGAIYGIPSGSSSAGAVMYNKKVYEKYNLSVPHTWNDFIKNCEIIKAGGDTALIGTFKDSWTSQVLFLGDNYNICSKNPDFPKEFESGNAKYLTTPVALRSFQKLSETRPFYGEDFLAATYIDGVTALATGSGAHWIMLTQVLSTIEEIFPDSINDIGVFGVPGDDPEDHGITVWNSAGFFGNAKSPNREAILAFMEFYISQKALDEYSKAAKPVGPFEITGARLSEDVYPAVREDMMAYFKDGKTDTALEFKTSVKGLNLPNICTECASGQTSPEEAAAIYDKDCYKQALQMNLNWR